MNLKERLEKSRELYTEMWAFHLKSITYLAQNNYSNESWETVIQASNQFQEKHNGNDFLIPFLMNEIEKTVKGK